MSLERELQSSPPVNWHTRKAIIFDWYDGPREGVCALASPKAEFLFELLDERFNSDDLDDRVFRVKELPEGSVDSIWASLADLGPPDKGVWSPVWKFSSDSQQKHADRLV